MKATAVEKHYFPWQYEKFAEILLLSIERLHWQDCHLKGSYLSARSREKRRIASVTCALDFTLTASFTRRGEGIDLTLSVSEENNTWSTVECKKKCTVLLDILCEPLFPRQQSDLKVG